MQGWGLAILVGVPSRDTVFKTSPYSFLDGKTLTGTAFGDYKPKTGLPSVVDLFMSNVSAISDSLYCHRFV